jgi:hypothetical protein
MVAVIVTLVGALPLASTKYPPFFIFALFGQFFAPFPRKALNIVYE